MAFTVTNVTASVVGKWRIVVNDYTADAAEGAPTSGLSTIFFSTVSEKKKASFIASGNTSYTSVTYFDNKGTTSTVAAGVFGMSGCVANNIYRVMHFGPS